MGCSVNGGEDFGAGVGIKFMPVKAEKEALANRLHRRLRIIRAESRMAHPMISRSSPVRTMSIAGNRSSISGAVSFMDESRDRALPTLSRVACEGDIEVCRYGASHHIGNAGCLYARGHRLQNIEIITHR